MRTLYLIAGFVFLGFAGLQYNDSNAGIWATMFALTGIASFLKIKYRPPATLIWLGSLCCFLGAVWTASHEIYNPGCMIKTDVPGPLLCAFWLGFLAWKNKPVSITH